MHAERGVQGGHYPGPCSARSRRAAAGRALRSACVLVSGAAHACTRSSTACRRSTFRSTKNITSTKSAKEPLRSQNDTAPSHASGPDVNIAAPTAGAMATAVASE